MAFLAITTELKTKTKLNKKWVFRHQTFVLTSLSSLSSTTIHFESRFGQHIQTFFQNLKQKEYGNSPNGGLDS